MSQEATVEVTYIRNREIATWHYTVDSNPPGINLANAEERAPWLANLVFCALNALEGFAQANRIWVSTDTEGERSFTITSSAPQDLDRLDSFLRSKPDVSDVTAWLSLKCIQLDEKGLPEDFFIHNNGWLFIVNNMGKCRSTEDGLFRVSFNFETDIYSPIADFDNRTLAALNAPRLRKFLHRLEEIPSLKFDEIDDPVGHIEEAKKYGVVDRYGFKMPDDPSAFEEMLQRESAK